jgi:ketosteroid isomerase-like protein
MLRLLTVALFRARISWRRRRSGLTDTLEQNKAILRAFLEAFDEGDLDSMMALCSDDYVWQGSDPAGIGVARGKEAFRQAVQSFRDALPDCRTEILDMVAENDRVAVRFWEYGHHTGAEWLGVQPAGAFVEWYPFAIYRVADGKLAEEWFTDDPYQILKCLGVKTIE